MATKSIIFVLFCLFLFNCAPFPDIPENLFSPETETGSDSSENSNSGDSVSEGGSTSGGQTASVDSNNDNNPGVETGSDVPATEELVDPQGLVLNEIYYDAPGSDTDGVLFVELYAQNAGSLDYYTIRFVNGENGLVTEMIELPEGTSVEDQDFYVIADGRTGALETTQVTDYDLIDNFDPQNGPDGVQLLDREGGLLDSVVYGEGAVSLSDDGFALGEGLPAIDADSGYSISRLEPGLDTDDNASDFFVNEIPSPGSGDVAESVE